MTTSRTPAACLAHAARGLCHALASQPIAEPLRAWRTALATTDAEFADLLAQTLACAAAATRLVGADRNGVLTTLPPFLREMLDVLMNTLGREIPQIQPLFDAIEELAPVDPNTATIAFYEAFLAEYDGHKRRHRGVFYTPRPVVSFIVRSIDRILRTEFDLEDGLADTVTWGQLLARQPGLELPDGLEPDDPFVRILDPATGSGTFLAEVVDLVHHTMTARWQTQGQPAATITPLWTDYVRRHLLPRLHGFELMLGPYAIAHIELRARLAATGYAWSPEDRLHIHLANALEEPHPQAGSRACLPATFVQEMRAADHLKTHAGLTVVLGNPPYAGTSRNTSPWITQLIDDYRFAAGQSLGERNPSWLLDDYVKFLRLGQHLLDRSGSGVLGMVTNHGFLANPTFRGMRESLAGSFARIAIVDLHGGVKKRSVRTGGKRDENVFDIRQGVCISLMSKHGGAGSGDPRTSRDSRTTPSPTTVAHTELWGPRADKLAFLSSADISTCVWKSASCTPPHRVFQPVDAQREAEYARFRSLHGLFALKGWGLKTRKDYLLVDFDREPLVEKFNALAALPADEAIRRFGIRQSPYWDFAAAQRHLPADSSASVQPVLFRPFDVRHVYYEKCMIERGDHKFELMHHMPPGNLALITVRRNESLRTFDHVFCTRHIAVLHAGSAKEANFFYPAFTYEVSQQGPQPNLAISDHAQPPASSRVAPDEFHYLYAILHSPAYRQRYGELLRVDFPRIPWGVHTPLFDGLAAWGADLVALHLLEADYPAASWNRSGASGESPFTTPAPRFVGSSTPSIARGYPKYDPAGRVLVNPSCWFEGVSAGVWEFRIGGYRVLHNWLKDRRGRALLDEDVAHCRAIVVALEQTLHIAERIDELIALHGDWPTAFEQVQ